MKSGDRHSNRKKYRISPSIPEAKPKRRGRVSRTSKTGKVGKVLPPQSNGPASKKIGGVKITLRRVDDTPPSRGVNLPSPPGNCPCGKTFQQCDDEWDKVLRITSRSAESYAENLQKVRSSEIAGDDPYHYAARRNAERDGQEPDPYRPYMPSGSFTVAH